MLNKLPRIKKSIVIALSFLLFFLNPSFAQVDTGRPPLANPVPQTQGAVGFGATGTITKCVKLTATCFTVFKNVNCAVAYNACINTCGNSPNIQNLSEVQYQDCLDVCDSTLKACLK